MIGKRRKTLRKLEERQGKQYEERNEGKW